MAHGKACSIEISLIVVTNDPLHARDVLVSLSAGRYRYRLTEIANRETMIRDFDAAVETARGKRPALVFLDCAFLNDQAEIILTHIRTLKRSMAIECIATRPPAELSRRARLSMLGATLFDGEATVAEAVSIH